jgi:hypothetical protein
MTDHAQVETADQDGDDFAARQRTYRFFVRLVKCALAVVAVILLAMAIFLA